MNYFTTVLLCAFLAVALGAPEIDQAKVKQSLDRLKEAHKACNENPSTQVDLEAVKKAQQDKTPLPANLGAHTLCVSKKVGWQNEDGSLNEASIRSKIKEIMGDRPDLEAIINDALTPQANPEETALHLVDAYRKHLPRPSGTRPRPNEK